MVQIITMPLGAYQTNCYVVRSPEVNTCVVIDPGYMPQQILSCLQKEDSTIEAILLTHGHFDHVGAVKVLAEKTGAAVYLHEAELSLPEQLTNGPLYYTHTYKEGDVLSLAGLSFRVLHTPGHTAGSVCLAAEDSLFTGDTLFQDSCGRTDLGGSWTQMHQSLQRLKALEQDYRVYPGHGPDTTLSEEKQYNPYMR